MLREGLGSRGLMRREQHAYRTILKSLSSMSTSFDASSIDQNVDLVKIIHCVLGDNPSVIYFDKTQIKILLSTRKRKVEFLGVLPRFQVNKMATELG